MSWTQLRALETASIAFENEEDPEEEKWLAQLLVPGSSLGGARPKASVTAPDGSIWIAKFPSRNDEWDMSLGGDFNLRRLERYLSLAWESGALPAVVLTKADLCDDVSDRLRAAAEVAPGVDVLVTDSTREDGYREVLERIGPSRTAALVGSSGVGKSTLVNRLVGADCLATGGVRDDGRGRHTTVRRELVLLPNGGIVIDTPGMRELGMAEPPFPARIVERDGCPDCRWIVDVFPATRVNLAYAGLGDDPAGVGRVDARAGQKLYVVPEQVL